MTPRHGVLRTNFRLLIATPLPLARSNSLYPDALSQERLNVLAAERPSRRTAEGRSMLPCDAVWTTRQLPAGRLRTPPAPRNRATPANNAARLSKFPSQRPPTSSKRTVPATVAGTVAGDDLGADETVTGVLDLGAETDGVVREVVVREVVVREVVVREVVVRSTTLTEARVPRAPEVAAVPGPDAAPPTYVGAATPDAGTPEPGTPESERTAHDARDAPPAAGTDPCGGDETVAEPLLPAPGGECPGEPLPVGPTGLSAPRTVVTDESSGPPLT